jgi:NADH-quinone oxidoreductase subunit B
VTGVIPAMVFRADGGDGREMSNGREDPGSSLQPRLDERGPTSVRVRATRLEQALDWAAGLAPSPIRFATSCCGMSMARGGDFFEAFGTGPPASSSRSADLLIVAGSLTRREVPLVREIYQRMLEPRWVIAWGACAISGGAYDNYATISGLSRILPVDLVVPGCPPGPEALRDALELLRSGASRDPGRASREALEWPIQKDPEDG